MSEREFTFKLIQSARKSGGDKYETSVEGDPRPWQVYVPQSISRAFGEPKKKLIIKVS